MSLTRKHGIVLIALATIGATTLVQAPANAGFTVTGLESVMTFKVNGTAVMPTGDAYLNSLLNLGATNSNSLDVGFALGQPGNVQGQAIILSDAGGNTYKVYGIAGVFLTNGLVLSHTSTISFDDTTPTLTPYPGGPAVSASDWVQGTGDGADDPPNLGYLTNFGAHDHWLAYKATDSLDAKTWTDLPQYGTFQFNNLAVSPTGSKIYLGLDVWGEVFNSAGVSQGFKTNWVTLGDVGDGGGGGGSVVPEASTLALLGFGGLPLIVAAARARRKR